ncbi:nucleotide sugar dehydrogenase [Salibacterium qingdaonense]|uniref:Nucleotide sugar dehydrogenase n=1 Tax=Salibacterium qingdaonense TaxID=266892 RepID=A0A1I4MDV6_9BACI|nr:nucleotide sugar dehydrogenase [Salibacterium qingdaonense]SFM01582.1 nucleotide sugar dehydrogenase [Salibacterium qingdaonense]
MNHNNTAQTVAVVGLGKIGLTLAAVFADSGFDVIGTDRKKEIVALVNKGFSHVKNEPGLDQLVHKAVHNGRLRAVQQTPEAAAEADVVVVIVPVAVNEDNEVDYSFMDAAVEDIGAGLTKGTTVIFETTLPVGDTRNRFGRRLEDISGLKAGTDFYLAYSPERVYSNQMIHDLQHYPKIVGGTNGKGLQTASAFYKQSLHCEVIEVDSAETAEFSKTAECVYRDVNIALANELAVYAEKKGVDISEAVKAGNSQPFSHIHTPGIGVGGHCIPIYPYFFIKRGLQDGLTSMARKINDSMAAYAVAKMEDYLETLEHKNVLILGLSYRGNVKEPTKTTTFLLTEALKQRKARVYVNDPLFTDQEISAYDLTPLSLEDEKISQIDTIILQAFHHEYQFLSFDAFTNCKLIFDGRNDLNKENITALGIYYERIGL